MSEEIIKEGKLIGQVTHYFGKIGVVIVKLSDTLRVGDSIRVVGGKTDFNQNVESLEVNHQKVKEAKSGELVGIKINQKVREGYKVYKL